MDIQQEKLFICQCDHIKHLVRVMFCRWGNGDEEIIISPILNYGNLNFWGRIKVALKYLFRKIDDNWPYGCVVLNAKQSHQLRNFINETILVSENIR